MGILNKRLRRRIRTAATYTALCAIVLVLIFPFLWMLSTSIRPPAEMFQKVPRFIPDRPTLRNYVEIWTDGAFAGYFRNSLIVASFTTILSVAVGIFGAYTISRFRFRGRNAYSVWLLITQMVPPVLLVIPLFAIMWRLRLVNTLWALIITHSTIGLPFCTWMLKGYFDGIPKSLEEAAMVDGCTRLEALWRIVFPLSTPGIVAVALYAFILSWQEYLFALTLTKTVGMRTLPVGISLYLGEYEVLWGRLMAGSVIMTVPVVLFFTHFQKYLVRGLTLGAVKE